MQIPRLTASRLLALVLMTATALGAEAKPSILVETFENPANYRQSTIGNSLTDIFVTELAKSGRFRVIESSPSVDRQSLDLVFIAKVTNFSFQEKEVAASTVDLLKGASAGKQYEQTIDVRIDFRVTDPVSQEVIFADRGESKATTRGAVAMSADFNRLVAAGVSASTREFMGSMMGRASLEAIGNTVRRLSDYYDIVGFDSGRLEGVVLGIVDPDTVVVSLGTNSGLSRGDSLNILRESPITNSQGEVIYKTQKPVGRFEVVECQEDRALARRREGAAGQEDDLVVRPSTKLDFDARIDRGKRFEEKQFYSAAQREFQAALDAQPDSGAAIAYLASANLLMKNFAEAFEGWNRLIASGQPLLFSVTHKHTFNFCRGTLQLTKDSLKFSPVGEQEPDHCFDIPYIQVSDVNASGDSLRIRCPSLEGKDKNWTFQVLLDGVDSAESAEIGAAVVQFIAGRIVQR